MLAGHPCYRFSRILTRLEVKGVVDEHVEEAKVDQIDVLKEEYSRTSKMLAALGIKDMSVHVANEQQDEDATCGACLDKVSLGAGDGEWMVFAGLGASPGPGIIDEEVNEFNRRLLVNGWLLGGGDANGEAIVAQRVAVGSQEKAMQKWRGSLDSTVSCVLKGDDALGLSVVRNVMQEREGIQRKVAQEVALTRERVKAARGILQTGEIG